MTRQGMMHSDFFLQGLSSPPREEKWMPFLLIFRCTPLALATTEQSFNKTDLIDKAMSLSCLHYLELPLDGAPG